MTIRRPLIAAALLIATTPCFAVNKDMVQLQTQMQTLQDSVARLQKSNDESMGVLKDLVQQTADNVNKMTAAMDTMQKSLQAQQDAQGAKVDQVSGQVQSLNDSIDELKAQMARLAKSMQDLEAQEQSINASVSSMPQGGSPASPPASAAPAPSPDTNPPTAAPSDATPPPVTPIPDILPQAGTTKSKSKHLPPSAAAAGAPPVEQLYQTAYGDLNAGKNTLAAAEFADVARFYPDDNLAGNAHFYMGELLMKQNKPSAAAKEYDKVLEQYPGNSKIPAAQLHKANALIAIKQTDAAVRELKSLIQRYPNSPEAHAAHVKLESLGSRVR